MDSLGCVADFVSLEEAAAELESAGESTSLPVAKSAGALDTTIQLEKQITCK